MVMPLSVTLPSALGHPPLCLSQALQRIHIKLKVWGRSESECDKSQGSFQTILFLDGGCIIYSFIFSPTSFRRFLQAISAVSAVRS